MLNRSSLALFSCIGLLILALNAFAETYPEPQPGDIFKEYKVHLDFWRVGSRWGSNHWDVPNSFSHAVDLADAERAETMVSKVLCHDRIDQKERFVPFFVEMGPLVFIATPLVLLD